MSDAPHLAVRIAHRVVSLTFTGERPVGRRPNTTRLSGVDITVQLAHHQQVDSGRSLAPQRRQVFEFWWHAHLLQTGEEPSSRRSPRIARFGRSGGLEMIEAGIADRAEQHGNRRRVPSEASGR